jgi:hypothetical protein
MTQHHDPVHPDEGDLDSADELHVSGLLARLPAVAMPAEVVARLDAALAVLGPYSASDASDAAGADDADDADAAGPVAAQTVVPISAAASQSSRWRNPRVLQAAAALVLVLAAGVVGIKALSSSSGTSDGSAAAGAPAPVPQVDTPVTRTGTAYTATSLATDVRSLVSGKLTSFGANGALAGSASPPGVTAATPSGTTLSNGTAQSPGASLKAVARELQTLTASASSLAPCIALIEDGLPSAVAPIAVDAGTYDAQPALIVVLPGADDPTAYDVWIVGPTCGQNKDAALIRYQSVPRT